MGREKYGVPAPAVSGNPEWERMFRVQQNTLEQLMIFLPALWVFAHFVSPVIGAAIGVLFLIGRPIYFAGYVRAPEKRSASRGPARSPRSRWAPEKRTAGFLMGFLANVVLVVGGLGGVIRSWL